MITLFILLTLICLVGLAVLIVGGLFAVFWPLAVILVIGILIDCLVLKKLLGK